MPKPTPVILIVDDDDQVLETIQTTLTSLGYRVILATNADAALEIIRFYAGIDRLITDIVMPGSVDGWELAHRAKQIRPELRVVSATGFAGKALPDRGRPGYEPLLAKPWRAHELAAPVHRTLRRSRQTLAPA